MKWCKCYCVLCVNCSLCLMWPWICLCVPLLSALSLFLSACQPACLSAYLPVCLSVCLTSLSWSPQWKVYSLCQCFSVYACLSVCLHVFLSTRFVLSLSGKMKSQESKTVVGIITKVIICQWRSLSCPHVCLCLQFKTRCYAMMKSLKSCKREIKPLIGGPGLSVSWRLLATVRQAPCTG